MAWEVAWRVIDGPEGRAATWASTPLSCKTRPWSSPCRSPAAPRMREADAASRAAAWAQRFTLQVVGEDTGTRAAPVTAPEAQPLRVRYRFLWTGPKRLAFTGTPNTTVPTYDRATRHAIVSREAAFAPVDLSMRLEVLSAEAHARRFGRRALEPAASDTPLGPRRRNPRVGPRRATATPNASASGARPPRPTLQPPNWPICRPHARRCSRPVAVANAPACW